MKLYKFYADWCQPCKTQSKLLEDLVEKIEIIPINIEDESSEELCQMYGVKSLPTLVLTDEFKDVIKIWHGVTHPKEISEAIDKLEELDTEK